MIRIVPYRAEWCAEFKEIAAVIRSGLGALALRIDHIGSTAIPGLCAKDVIDLQITVARLDNELSQKLCQLGFIQRPEISNDHRPPGALGPASDWAKLYFKQAQGQRRCHIHVRQAGRPNQRYPLLFRDYLRAHPQSAAAYGELKQRLAAGLAEEADYAEVKDPAVDLIYFAAEAWAQQIRWQAGSAD